MTSNYNMMIDTEVYKTTTGKQAYMLGVVVFDNTGKQVFNIGYQLLPAFTDITSNANKHATAYNKVRATMFDLWYNDDLNDELYSIIDDYGIYNIYGYNVGYDIYMLKQAGVDVLSNLVNCGVVKTVDLLRFAMLNILPTKPYCNYCKKHHAYNRNGLVSATLQDILRYIKQDKWYRQKHTAVSDSIDTVEIYKVMKSRKKRLTWK